MDFLLFFLFKIDQFKNSFFISVGSFTTLRFGTNTSSILLRRLTPLILFITFSIASILIIILQLIKYLIISQITQLLYWHLLKIQLFLIKFFKLAFDCAFLCVHTASGDETQDEEELMEMEGWFLLLSSLFVEQWATDGCIRVVVIVVCLHKHVICVELLFTVCDRWEGLLDKDLQSFDIEQMRDQVAVMTKL